jgi:hypothetical protein
VADIAPAFQKYIDIGLDSGIAEYLIGADYIRVKFKDGSIYDYNYLSAGELNIEEMKRLAIAGDGLNTFINRNTYSLYSSKQLPVGEEQLI